MAECLTKMIFVGKITTESPSNSKNGDRKSSSRSKKVSLFDERDVEAIDLRQWMRNSCLRLNTMLKADKTVETYLSGSTGVIVLVFKDKIITANVGDSGAILIKRDDTSRLRAVNLTREMKPSIKEERDRIIAFGGEIRQYEGKLACVNDP